MAEEQDKKEKPKATLIKHRKPQESKPASTKTTEKKKVVVIKKKAVVRKTVHKVVAKKDESVVEAAVEKHTPQPAAVTTEVKDTTKGGNESSVVKQTEKSRPRTDQQNGSPQIDSKDKYPQRPRQSSPQSREQGTRPPYADQRTGQRTSQGSRPPYAGQRTGQRTSQGSRPPYAGQRTGQRTSQGGRPPYAGQRTGQGSRPPYAGQRTGQGSRPPYAGQRTGQGGRPPYAGQRTGQGGRPPYAGQRTGQGGRPPYAGNRGKTGGGFSSELGKDDLNKKHTGKKFFKAKKKTTYQKNKKEAGKEIDFNIKKKTVIMSNPVPKSIDILEAISVSELAKKMNLKASELIGKLMSMGMMVSINQQIDAETAELIASEYDCKINVVSLYDETIIETEESSEKDLVKRSPIVTVMGHVDHGKTKLLDAIRETDIVSGEYGGITQHIGAYKVNLPQGDIVFLDTPGHEAFTLMRARGAQITDIVVLVVAANDGVMPQTVEAIHHAKDAGVPIIVVINKIDLPDANPERVKQQLADYDLLSEDWGGSTLFCNVSALKKEGIKNLLDSILLQADLLELKANPDARAEGSVLESKIDHGRGIVASIIIQNGTLKVGDAFVAGVYNGKVRALFDDRGNRIESAPPGTPVEVVGFTGVPDAGSPFQVTKTEKIAKQIGEKRQELEKQGEAKNVKKITLDNVYDSIQEGKIMELKVIIKGDVHGSVEALKNSLEKLSTDEIHLQVIHAAAGAILENDINLASASDAIIIGFHVRPTSKAQMLADKAKVDIRKYNIIYDAVEDVKSAMEGLLAPELQEMNIGTVEVRDLFKVPKIGVIAGCHVTKGKVKRGSSMHIFRDGVEIHTGKISSLKRFKDDVKEVAEGYECGIGIENFNELKEGDIFEVFEVKEVARKL